MHDPHQPSASHPLVALSELQQLTFSRRDEPTPQASDHGVNIPLEDVTAKVEEINQAAEYAKVLALKQAERAPEETTQEHNERVKREFTEKVLEARRQAHAPPPPPQPVARAITEQTAKEMAAGAKQSAYWAEQQKLRPPPSAKDLQAMGQMTTVFSPDSYTHEKGVGVKGKDYTNQNLGSFGGPSTR